jgi:hypothetical protein
VIKTLEDEALRNRGIEALHQILGPVQALRFLALLSREPFDYAAWREKYFAGKSLDDILAEAKPSPL